MIACLDACVLFPTVLREVLLACARDGQYRPVWSPRILEEWARAADRHGAGEGAVARGEIAMLRQAWPGAEIEPGETDDLWLPDAADIHVLGSARAAGAAVIVTMNLRDFPPRELRGHDLRAEHPDAFLMALFQRDAARVEQAARSVHHKAETLSGEPVEIRALFKRARLPRLGKALAR